MPYVDVKKIKINPNINGESVPVTHTIFYRERGGKSSEKWTCRDTSAYCCNTAPRDGRGNFLYNPHGPNCITYYRNGKVRFIYYGVESIDYQKKTRGVALKCESFTCFGRKSGESYYNHPEGFEFVEYLSDGSVVLRKGQYGAPPETGVFYREIGCRGNILKEIRREDVEWGTFRSSKGARLICSIEHNKGLVTTATYSLFKAEPLDYLGTGLDTKDQVRRFILYAESGALTRVGKYKTRDGVEVFNKLKPPHNQPPSLLEFYLGKLR